MVIPLYKIAPRDAAGAQWFCYVVSGHWFIFLAILSYYSEYKAIPHISLGKFKQYDDAFILKNTSICQLSQENTSMMLWNFNY